MKVSVELGISVGQTFPAFKDLEEAIHKTCKENLIQFYRSNYKKIEPVMEKNTQKYCNPNIIYTKIKYACIYEGVKCIPSRRDPRKSRTLFRKRCGAFVKAVVTRDGQQLMINGICNIHNHPVQKGYEIKCKRIKAAIEENVKKIRVQIESDNSSEDLKPIEFTDVFINKKLRKFMPHVS